MSDGNLPMTDPEDRRKHLDFIQAVVTRMSAASSGAKGWLLPVVTAAYGFALVQHSGSVAILGLVAVIVFAYLDAHYLDQERAYRRLYNVVAAGDERIRVYSLDPADADDPVSSVHNIEQKPKARTIIKRWTPEWRIWASWSIAPFYGVLMLLGIGVLIYALLK